MLPVLPDLNKPNLLQERHCHSHNIFHADHDLCNDLGQLVQSSLPFPYSAKSSTPTPAHDSDVDVWLVHYLGSVFFATDFGDLGTFAKLERFTPRRPSVLEDLVALCREVLG